MAVSSTGSAATAINNVYNSVASKNKGLGGLVSGLDTESMVEAMLLGTRNKIGLQQQQRQLVQWKQTAYRGVATAMSEFKSKYFDLAKDASQNMMTNRWFNVFKGTSSNDSVKLRLGSTTTSGSVQVNSVEKLSSSKTYTSGQMDTSLTGSVKISDLWDSFTGTLSDDFKGQSITILLDDFSTSSRTIKLDDLYDVDLSLSGGPPPYTSDAHVVAALQELINAEFGDKPDPLDPLDPTKNVPVIEVKLNTKGGDNYIEFFSDENKLTVTQSDVLGFTSGQSNRLTTSMTLQEAFPDLVGAGKGGNTFTFNINGVKISVTSDETLETVMTRINNAGADCKIEYNSQSKNFTLTASISGTGSTLEIEDVQGNFLNQLFGVKGGNSLETTYNKDISTGYSRTMPGGSITKSSYDSSTLTETYGTLYDLVEDLYAGGTPVSGGFQLTIGNTVYNITVDLDTTKYDDMWDRINEKLEEITGMSPPNTADLGNDEDKWAKYLNFVDSEYQKLYLETVNEAIYEQTKPSTLVTLSVSGDGKLQLNTTSNALYLEIGTFVPVGGLDLCADWSFTSGDSNYDPTKATTLGGSTGMGVGTTNTVTINVTAPALAVNTYTFNYNPSMTLHDFAQEVYTQTSGAFLVVVEDGVVTLTSANPEIDFNMQDNDTTEDNLLNGMFGVNFDEVTGDCIYETSAAGTVNMDEGKNAVIYVEGIGYMTSTSNIFSVNGIQFEVNEKVNEGWAVGDPTTNAIHINVEPDNTELANKLQEFIDDYNAMLMTLTSLIYEKKAGVDEGEAYPPLTEEQKADMTEDEITKWETKAKQGILNNDDTLRRIVNQLREAMYQTVEAAGLAPYMVGISTVSLYDSDAGTVSYEQSGLLQLDSEKLLEALEQNGSQVVLMFTAPEEGLARRLDNIIKAATNTDSGKDRGTLISLAGTTRLTADNTSILGDRLKDIDQRISNLKYRLEMEYTRYWKKFSTLETTLANLSAQSSWLLEQTS